MLTEAKAAGVTRLADITCLDRIGFPVWQAVRPAGRAQSVHQGKGCSELDAKIGALAEALESHCAERVQPDRPKCRWDQLPPENRCPDPNDCSTDKSRECPDEIDWCDAADLRSGRTICLPHLFVSLDFTLRGKASCERSSAGLAIGTSEAEAVETGFLEILERDAVGGWRRLAAAQKAAHRVDMESIAFPWFREWRSRISAAGATIRLFAINAVEGTPVCIVYLDGLEAFGPSRRLFYGSAAHGSPEIALFKALAEAIQSRLTFIAGVRDDMLPSLYRPRAPGTLLGAAGLSRVRTDFRRLEPICATPEAMAERLAALGYDIVAIKRLDPENSTIPVVKVFAPGLGSLHRKRRTPL